MSQKLCSLYRKLNSSVGLVALIRTRVLATAYVEPDTQPEHYSRQLAKKLGLYLSRY